MANVVKWLTHLAVNQTFVSSILIVRPKSLLEIVGFFIANMRIETVYFEITIVNDYNDK